MRTMFSIIKRWFSNTKEEGKVIDKKKRRKPIWTIEVKNQIIGNIEKDNYRKSQSKEKKEEDYILNARYNIIDMMTQHCKIKCFEKWIKIEELQKIFYLSDSYQYDVCRRHKNYRIIMDKYVMHIWYNWSIITIYYDDKEERDKRAEEYAKNSFDWKQVLFYPINKKIVWDSINKFVKKD